MVVLSGCNSNSSPAVSTASAHKVSGTAAVGASVAGFVYVKDSLGTEVNTAIDAAGKFSIDVDGMQAPFMIKVVPNDTHPTMYSFAWVEGNSNATPLTNLALFLATDKADLDSIYDTWDGTTIEQAKLISAQATINANLASKIESAGLDPNSYNFVTEPFDADSSGIDGVLDAINVVVDLQMGVFTFQVVDDAAFVFDENINATGVYIGSEIEWPNGGEAAYPVVASMMIEGVNATYTVFDNNSFIFGTPYFNGDHEEVALIITMDESGVLTLMDGNDTLVLTDPVIYKEQPNQIIWKDSNSGYWVAGIVTPTSSGAIILTFEVTTAFHHDEAGYTTQGLIEFDVSPLP
jgi:hypothetical protein